MNEFEKIMYDHHREYNPEDYEYKLAYSVYSAGVAAERERCARVAENMAGWPPETPANCCQEDYENYHIAKDIAAAIRGIEWQ